MSVRSEILANLVSRLDAAVAPVTVYLRRVTDLPQSAYPAVLVVPGNTPVRNAAGGVVEHAMEVTVAVLTQGAAAVNDAETIAAALLAAVGTDRTWGGLATDTTLTAINEEKEQADHVRYGLALVLSIRFESAHWAF
jgi:hypothetical protein